MIYFYIESLINKWMWKIINLDKQIIFNNNKNLKLKQWVLKASALCLSVCLSVCPCVRLLLRCRLNVFPPPLPEVGCPIFFVIQNPWGENKEKKWSQIWTLLFGSGLKSPKKSFLADFALQNMIETMLSDGLETSGQRVYS